MASDSRYHQGGLMRCCIVSIMDDENEEYEGRVLACDYGNGSPDHTMIFREDAWHWNKDHELDSRDVEET